MLDIVSEKLHDETRQGEVFSAGKGPDAYPKKFYIESYGCAMNFSDSEIVASILSRDGFEPAQNYLDADLVLINTCAIRDNAEQRVRHRLRELRSVKKKNPGAIIGVLGCMAERLKSK